jgi:crossover junction endodeoxyribonuclease RusA
MTKEGKAQKEVYQWEAKAQWRRPVFTEELSVKISFYFKDKRRRDIDNYNKILLDALTGIVYSDDKQIIKLVLTKQVDSKNPRIEFTIK